MIIESGHFALILALMLALMQSIVPFWGARKNDATLMGVGNGTAIGQLIATACAFAALIHAHVVSDFSLVNVVENSHSLKPLIYKVTGVWGNHEGSMLLWVLILALFGACVALFGRKLPPQLKADVLAVQGWIGAAFFIFILATSNPFARLSPAPLEGKDLNPLLQDIGLAIHPPLLYVGYVGFSIAFAFAVAALIGASSGVDMVSREQGFSSTGTQAYSKVRAYRSTENAPFAGHHIDASWARWVRPWTLAAWLFLTLGIAMGSYWAYYELGWGGFWFWDPVENASLMPWLAGTALLHSATVMEKRDALKIWTVLLAILTFSLSLLGTFLVRSGVLTSVHAFAVDPLRGLFILAILSIFVGGSLTLYAWRAAQLKPGGLFAPVSREGALVLNNIFLTTACLTVVVGTLYPLALETLTGQKISVGAPYFNATFGPLAVPLLLAMPLGPLLAWKRGDVYWAAQRLWAAAAAALALAMLLFAVMEGGPVLAPLGVGLAAFTIMGALTDIAERTKLFRAPPAESLRRLLAMPGAAWGSALGHAGIGVTMLGIVASTAWSGERIEMMKAGDLLTVSGYSLKLDSLTPRTGSNHEDLVAIFSIRRGGRVEGTVEAAKRLYTVRQMTMTEAGLATFGVSQLYVSLGEITDDMTIAVRATSKPLVLLIWLGGVVMALGGICSLFDRRLRVGIVHRKLNRHPGEGRDPRNHNL